MLCRNFILAKTVAWTVLLLTVYGQGLNDAGSRETRSKNLDILSSTVDAIVLNITQNVTVSCSIPDPSEFNITTIYSLEIYLVNNGQTSLLGTVHADDGVSVKPGASQTYTDGALGKNGNFLDLTWSKPGPEAAGLYTCDGTGAGNNGPPVFFTSTLQLGVREASYEELTNQIQNLIEEKEKLTGEKEKVENALKKAQEKINMLEENGCLQSCDDLVMAPGLHVAKLNPADKLGPITALCEVSENGQIWTVFQHRFNGSVDFNRNFSDYENGFGSADGEFWMGLKNIRRLLLQNGDNNTLRVDMKELKSDANYSRVYPVFSLGPANSYMLTVDGFDDRGHGMSYNSGSNFSTYDHDFSDGCPGINRKAGWWFPFLCGYVNLNGLWGVEGGTTSMFWHEFRGDNNHPMGTTVMKFRKN